MFTYQVRPRVFRRVSAGNFQFPADCTIRVHFLPEQPFGVSAAGGRTAVRAVAAEAMFNANTGEHYVESREPLQPLQVIVEDPSRVVKVKGATLTVSQRFESLRKLEDVIASVFFGLPALLNITFADPPFVERVDGTIGSAEFRWELREWRMEFMTTTQDLQEQHVAQAWERMGVLAANHRRRLIAGLHYFHVACRLGRAARTAGEFLPEVLLNLSKSLEAVFPPAGDGGTRDAVRDQLRTIGFTDREIETNYVPAMALRNEVDVGHVDLALFTTEQLKVIHAYTERAETAFRTMFQKLFEAIEAGTFDVAPYTASQPRKEVLGLIERLRQNTAEEEP